MGLFFPLPSSNGTGLEKFEKGQDGTGQDGTERESRPVLTEEVLSREISVASRPFLPSRKVCTAEVLNTP